MRENAKAIELAEQELRFEQQKEAQLCGQIRKLALDLEEREKAIRSLRLKISDLRFLVAPGKIVTQSGVEYLVTGVEPAAHEPDGKPFVWGMRKVSDGNYTRNVVCLGQNYETAALEGE